MKPSIIKRSALKLLTQSDNLLTHEDSKIIAAAMSLLSSYAGGYELFGAHLKNVSLDDCLDVFQAKYQDERVDDDRKKMGRYYTPNSLVRQLCGSTLMPRRSDHHRLLPLNHRLNELHKLPAEQRLYALLNFSLCDPACGSGVFLLRAAKIIGLEVARLISESDNLTFKQVEYSLLLASEHCIYGVDKDPLAVELCKLSLWLNATLQHQLTDLPLPPLSNIRCGDALVGVLDLNVLRQGIPDGAYKSSKSDDKKVATFYRQQNKKERSRLQITATSTNLEKLKTACNVWCAAFFVRMLPGSLIPTSLTVQGVLNDALDSEQQAVVYHCNQVAQRCQFFHWPLEFPDVLLAGVRPIKKRPALAGETP